MGRTRSPSGPRRDVETAPWCYFILADLPALAAASKVAEIAGLSRYEFIHELTRLGVSLIRETVEELAEESARGNSWVVNGSPLIPLAKVGRLDLLSNLTEKLVIPAAVVAEILAGPVADPAGQWLRGEGTRWVQVDAPLDPAVAAWDSFHHTSLRAMASKAAQSVGLMV